MVKSVQIAEAPPDGALQKKAPLNIVKDSDDVMALFGRIISDPSKITTVHFKKTLTRELISASNRGGSMLGMLGEMYQLDLPLAGRTDKAAPATVVDCYDFESKKEVTLVCNTMIKTAFERDGKALKGRIFAVEYGAIKADKQYRVCNVQEVDLEASEK